MSKHCTTDLEKDVCELKAMVRAQNKRIDLLIKHITDGCKQDDDCGPPESCICNLNPYLECLNPDFLHHLCLNTETTNFPKEFGDVRFVCMGGTAIRIEKFANFIMKEIGLKMCSGVKLKDISHEGHRYAMFKVGPVLCVNHGIGGPSISIVLHEVIKLVHYAKCQNPVFFRIGTCGSLGVEPGTVIITSEAVDGQLRPVNEVVVHGVPELRPTKLDPQLIDELKSLTNPRMDKFDIVVGKTLCTNDFYEGQSRMDGAFCGYTPEKKMSYLNYLASNDVVSIEMESTTFAGMTYQAGISAAVICVVVVNRLEGDQINSPVSKLSEFDQRPQNILARYMRKVLFTNEEADDLNPKCQCHGDE